MSDRRHFLRAALAVAALPVSARLAAQEASTGASSSQPALPRAGGGDAGTLYDPERAGRPRERTGARDNDDLIRETELRLKCPCPCSLDVFTCRTTDFTCTYSPERHRQVVALFDKGMTSQQVLDWFVAQDGEKALMAPKPAGFNLAGYFVPGLVFVAAASILTVILLRRRAFVTGSAAPPLPGAPFNTSMPTPGEPLALAAEPARHRAGTAGVLQGAPRGVDATEAELAELERLVRESDS